MIRMSMTVAELRKIQGKPKRSKYGNHRVEYDGHMFDSLLERDYYIHLKLREKLGEVYEVEMQRPYLLTINGKLIAAYRADFTFYDDRAKRNRVIDCKGVTTAVFGLKAKLMKAIHGIDVEIVKRGDF
jgi:Protein of unknown function (DUF1064)